MEPTQHLSCDRVQRMGAVMGKRWNMEILDVLTRSPVRFCDLRRSLHTLSGRQVSDRVLSERLKELQGCGFVLQVEGAGYSLTELGQRMSEPLEMMRQIADDMPA